MLNHSIVQVKTRKCLTWDNQITASFPM